MRVVFAFLLGSMLSWAQTAPVVVPLSAGTAVMALSPDKTFLYVGSSSATYDVNKGWRGGAVTLQAVNLNSLTVEGKVQAGFGRAGGICTDSSLVVVTSLEFPNAYATVIGLNLTLQQVFYVDTHNFWPSDCVINQNQIYIASNTMGVPTIPKIAILNRTTGAITKELTTDDLPIAYIAMTGDDKYFLVKTRDWLSSKGEVGILANGQISQTIIPLANYPYRPVMSPDRKLYIPGAVYGTNSINTSTTVVDAETERVIDTLPDIGGNVGIAFGDDPSYLYKPSTFTAYDDQGGHSTSFGVVTYSVAAKSWFEFVRVSDEIPNDLLGLQVVPGLEKDTLLLLRDATLVVSERWHKPFLPPNSLVNGASFAAGPVAPGSLVSMFGSDLHNGDPSAATSLPLPTELGGTIVEINGKAAPLVWAGRNQINFQIPFDAAVGSTLVVKPRLKRTDGTMMDGNTLSVTVTAAAPAVFEYSDGVIVTRPNMALVTKSAPMVAGENLTLWATGLGAVIPSIQTGAPAPANPLSKVVAPVRVTIGSVDTVVTFAGLAPGFVGLYQINFQVPAGIPSGTAQLAITAGLLPSPQYTVAVK